MSEAEVTMAHQHLATMFVTNLYPHDMVEDPAFIDFIGAVQRPSYKLPGRTSMTTMCDAQCDTIDEFVRAHVWSCVHWAWDFR